MPEKVAVIGAGALGLMATKNLIEAGFDVTGFESRAYVGGLWKDSSDNTLSVHATTVFNSSKYRAAISDFPFADHVDDFPTAPQLHNYLESYADHFDLRKHYHLNSRVTAIEDLGKQWALEVQTDGQDTRTECFDRVCISTGSFYAPKHPTIPGRELFAGKMCHSIEYHGPEQFKDQNVLILGIHASAQDVAASLSGTATKLWMAHRTGLLMFPRYMPDGGTYDQNGSITFVRFQFFLLRWFPQLWDWLFDKIAAYLSKTTYPDQKPEWGLTPAPSVAVAPPLIADRLYSLFRSGFATPVSAVRRITGPKSVELVSGENLADIDSIIFCTGYDFSIPFSPAKFNPYPVLGESPLLYHNIFPISPDPHIRNTLAYMGQVGIPLPGFTQHELVAIAIAQTWRGSGTHAAGSALPSLHEMTAWHDQNLAWRAALKRRYGVKHDDSVFYPVFVPMDDHLRWLDRVCGTGVFEYFSWWSWKSWKFWWEQRELYNLCAYGLFSPAIWRLFDVGYGRRVWDGARECVVVDNKRAKRQREGRKRMLQRQKEREEQTTKKGQ